MWDIVKKIIILCLCLLLFSYNSAKISAEHDKDVKATIMPRIIYVMDFELDTADIQSDTGLVKFQRERSGPLPETLSSLRGQKDPAVRSKELVDLMSKSLLAELGKRNLNASRLGTADPLPAGGLLVRGIFVHVEEGNRLRITVIGFGSGKTELQLVVSVDDLAQG